MTVAARRCETGMRSVLYAVQQGLFFLSVILFAAGSSLGSLDLVLAAVLVLYASNLVFGFLNLRERLLFLFLHLGIALFLLTRPVIGALDAERTWFLGSQEATMFALASLYMSLAFLLLGTVLADCVAAWNRTAKERRARLRPRIASGEEIRRTDKLAKGAGELQTSSKMRFVRIAALACFLICFAGSCYVGSIKLSYMQGLNYEDYYLIELSDHVPWVIDTLNTMTPYMMCAYLAAMPRRRPTLAVLVLYLATTVPMLMIGSRSDFVIAFLFAALYFVFRALTDKRERWIKRRTVVLVAVLVPLGVLAMGVINYTRSGDAIVGMGAFDLLADALFKQGVSFTVLGHGYDVNNQIQALGFKFYSLGGLTGTITEGFIGTTFLGFEDLGSVNSARLALNGFSYSHAMSFFAHPNYLGGEGYGSSYILELYADFGMGGIAVGSLLLSIALRALTCAMGRRWFWGMVALMSSMYVFHMPRGTALEWISFLWATRFLLAVVLVMAFSALLAFAARAARAHAVPVVRPRLLVREGRGVRSVSEVESSEKEGAPRNSFGLRVCPVIRGSKSTERRMSCSMLQR